MSIQAELQLARGEFSLDVHLNVPEQGISAIFGPSGCGKTTLLRAIAGLEPAVRGTLKVNGESWQSPGHFVPPHQRPIGYVFQEPSLFAHLDVRGNLDYGLRRLGRKAQRNSLHQAIELLGIGHLLARQPHQLSGGEQQRVAIARALAVSPALLLLDEPMAALDRERKKEILPYLDSLQKELGKPMLYVSHSRDEVARLADHLVLMNEGLIQASGSVTELFARLDLSLAREADTETVIEAEVAGHDPDYQLNWLDFTGGRFIVAGKPLPTGRRLRLQVMARDVSLTLAHQQMTSILNIFPATVEQVAAMGEAQVNVRLRIGATPLLARVTRKSADALELQPGACVYAQVKSVALLV